MSSLPPTTGADVPPASPQKTAPMTPAETHGQDARATNATVRLGRYAVIAAILIVIGLVVGLVPRWRARHVLAKETAENAEEFVSVVSPTPGKSDLGVPLPAEVQAFVEAPRYARAHG